MGKIFFKNYSHKDTKAQRKDKEKPWNFDKKSWLYVNFKVILSHIFNFKKLCVFVPSCETFSCKLPCLCVMIFRKFILTAVVFFTVFSTGCKLGGAVEWPSCTVVYNANGGSGEMENSVHKYGEEKPLNANVFTRLGFSFSGWAESASGEAVYTDGQSVNKLSTEMKETINLYAVWGVNNYTVIYNANGGSGTMENSYFTYGESQNLRPNAFTNGDYLFNGWARANNGIVEFADEASVNNLSAVDWGEVILYARWRALIYTVVYHANGGSGTMENTDFTYNEEQNLRRNTFTRIAHSFIGWGESPSGEVKFANEESVKNLTDVDEGTVNLYARWQFLLSPEMVEIPEGSFLMGSPEDEPGSRDNERPQHTVTLSTFSMSKYEVTQELYQAVTGVNPSYFQGTSDDRIVTTGEVQVRRPVENVTWFDAIEFCNKLSVIEGLTPVYTITGRTPSTGYPITAASVTPNWDANGYRLPTEAQWEYAAKGEKDVSGNYKNSGYVYSGSNDLDEVAWYYVDDSNERTHEVGLNKANGLGLYDMSGNVWEWCWDWWGSYTSGAKENPTGASPGSDRVVRGGSWASPMQHTRSAYRGYDSPNYRSNTYGFRLVRP